MHVAITGSSGLIGSALIPALRGAGHRVLRLVRRTAEAGEVTWDPARGILDGGALEGVDAVIHLSGEGLAAARWTESRKRALRESRLTSTDLLARTLVGLARRPGVLISTSAVGIYGDRGAEVLTEASQPGDGFLAQLAQDWEAAAAPAAAGGIRVAHPRFGVVLTPDGGALGKMLPPFRLGLGGPFGSGRQWMSWVTLPDVIGLLSYGLTEERVRGPFNAVAPEPVTNAEFARTLGAVLGRPAIVPIPALALRLALGEMADQALLASQRAVPERLLHWGYQFQHPSLERGLRAVLGT